MNAVAAAAVAENWVVVEDRNAAIGRGAPVLLSER